MELQERILHKGDELFRRHGIRSITMDDIAKHLGVSKKTIYQHYPDKDELVLAVTKHNINRHCVVMEQCTGLASPDAIGEMYSVNQNMGEMIRSFNPIMFYDLQKYHPKAWFEFRTFRNEFIKVKIVENMERGIREGIYRNDFDINILSRMRLEQVDMTFNYEIYPPSDFLFIDVMQTLTQHFLHGLVNEKGLALINHYNNTSKTV